MRHFITLLLAAVLAVPAAASSPGAWRQLQRQAERSCIQASDFRRPRVSNMILFEDSVGQVALLVTGAHRQPHMRGATGTNLCLYNRVTGRVSVQEAEGWSSQR